MDVNAFYERIEKFINRPLTELEVDFLDIACLPENLERLEEGLAGGWIDTLKGKVPEFISLEDVESRLSEGTIGYWLYDRNTKTWIINMNRGSHEHLAGTLYGIFDDNTKAYTIERDAEKYIEEQLGFFISGAMNMYIPIKDDRCILTVDEQVFNEAKGPHCWRGI